MKLIPLEDKNQSGYSDLLHIGNFHKNWWLAPKGWLANITTYTPMRFANAT